MVNESYLQRDLPADAYQGVLQGAYLLEQWQQNTPCPYATLMGSGAILTEILHAARQLSAQGFHVDVISVTSWSELARERKGYLHQLLLQTQGTIVAASDYVRALPESVRVCIPQGRSYTTLGTDGFGRSDTRAALRRYFQVDVQSIVQAVLQACA